MARTIEEITNELRGQYPTIEDMVDGEIVTLDADAYEARIAEWAVSVRDYELATEAQAERRQLRRQVRQALTLLERDTNPATLAQVRQILAGLIRALIGLNLIEDE